MHSQATHVDALPGTAFIKAASNRTETAFLNGLDAPSKRLPLSRA